MDISIETIFEKARMLEDFLNNDMLKKFGKMHNIDDRYNRLSVKQEMVAKKGYFLNVKKKYALHIINEGGVEKNEIMTRGLITRRSDYPDITKKKINELLNMILLNETVNIKQIRKFIEETECEIRSLASMGNKSIARPVSYSFSDKQYKKIPSHVIAMMWFNKLYYEAFKPGVKGYLFRIKGVNFSNITDKSKNNISEFLSTNPKYIAIPYEEEKLPDLFVIDIDASIGFAWKDRVQELLSPMIENIYPESRINQVTLFD